jgi:hypothetical protein
LNEAASARPFIRQAARSKAAMTTATRWVIATS